MKTQNLVTPLVTAVSLVLYSAFSSPDLSLKDYMAPLCMIFALAAKSIAERTEKYFVLVGYVFWTSAYLVMIYKGITLQRSTWPMMCGVNWVLNEYLVSFTSLFETKQEGEEKYVTPKYVRVGYGVFLMFDLLLNAITVIYGTGAAFDELGLLPMGTQTERITTFFLWLGFWTATNIAMARVFSPRQAKYFMYSFIYASHVSALRLPIFANYQNDAALSAILKLQTFGSAIFIVRFSSTTLPSPKIWFRALMIGMPLFCAWTSTTMFETVVKMSVENFAIGITAWLTVFWVVVVALTSKASQYVFGTTFSSPKVTMSKKTLAAPTSQLPAQE